MRFLCLYKPAKAEGAPPTMEEMGRMGQLVQDGKKAGRLLVTEGCMPSDKGARVRLSGGKFTVTDGPFTEAKELVAGIAVIDATSLADAIAYTREFLNVAGDGETEIRQIYVQSEMPVDEFTATIKENDRAWREQQSKKPVTT
jgi:hypothetical protein